MKKTEDKSLEDTNQKKPILKSKDGNTENPAAEEKTEKKVNFGDVTEIIEDKKYEDPSNISNSETITTTVLEEEVIELTKPIEEENEEMAKQLEGEIIDKLNESEESDTSQEKENKDIVETKVKSKPRYDPLDRFRKHSLLPLKCGCKMHDFSAINKVIELRTLHAKMTAKVNKLIKKAQRTKTEMLENSRLVAYRIELERNIMCLDKKNEMLSKQYDTLVENKVKDRVDDRNSLACEIEERDQFLKKKVAERDALYKVHTRMMDKFENFEKKHQKNQLIGNYFKEQREIVEKVLKDISEKADWIETMREKDINDLLEPRKLILMKDEQEMCEHKEIIRKIEQENAEIKLKNNELQEYIEETKAKSKQESNEKHAAFFKLESNLETRNELDDKIILQEKNLKALEKQKASLSADFKKKNETIDNLNKDAAKFKELCRALNEEKKNSEKSLVNLQDNLCQRKREIAQLMRTNMQLIELKQDLEMLCDARDKSLEDLKIFEETLKNERSTLIENTNRLKYVNSILKSELPGKIRKLEELLSRINEIETKNGPENILEQAKKENRRLREQIEVLEQIFVDRYKGVAYFISNKEFLTKQYKKLEENVKQLQRRKEETDSKVAFIECKLEDEARKNIGLKQNRSQLEADIANFQEDMDTKDMCEIADENKKISEQVAMMEFAIEQERNEATQYKMDIVQVTKENDLANMKQEEIKKIEEENAKLKAEIAELHEGIEEMKGHYVSVQECMGSLLGVIEYLKASKTRNGNTKANGKQLR